MARRPTHSARAINHGFVTVITRAVAIIITFTRIAHATAVYGVIDNVTL